MNNNEINNINSSYNNVEQQPTKSQLTQNNKINKKMVASILGVIIASIIILFVLKMFVLKDSSDSLAESYLPNKISMYDMVCSRQSKYKDTDNMTLYQIIGLREIPSYHYISYDFVEVISKNDGTAISQNENNITAVEEMVNNYKEKYLGVKGNFKDGNVVINYSISNYQYSKSKDAAKSLVSMGYECK